jgi:transposase
MAILYVGIDLAKNVFAVRGVDEHGKAVLVRPSVARARLDERIAEYDRHVVAMAREDERSRDLMQLPGIGSTTASALVSTIGNARDFKNGRQLAAWLGLVPGQYSSGGKTRLGGITKAGDGYLRTLLEA